MLYTKNASEIVVGDVVLFPDCTYRMAVPFRQGDGSKWKVNVKDRVFGYLNLNDENRIYLWGCYAFERCLIYPQFKPSDIVSCVPLEDQGSLALRRWDM